MDSQQRMRRQSSTVTNVSAKPRRGPGRQTPDQTKQRNLELLDQALDLFLEHGFERTTIDGIAISVGMAKRTVYLRYGNKTKLFKAALQRAIEEWIVPVERLRAAESDDLETTLLHIGQLLVTNVLSPAGVRLMRITNAESGRMPEIGQFTYRQGTAPTIAYLTDLMRRRLRTLGVQIADPEEAAVAFLYLVVGGPASMTAWGIALDRTEVDRHTQHCVRLFLYGLLNASPEKAARDKRSRGAKNKPTATMTATSLSNPTTLQLQSLEEENRRLKLLLAESVLEVARLKHPDATRRT